LKHKYKFIGGIIANAAARVIPVILLALLSAPFAVPYAAASGDQQQVRRYLLSAGANNGGRERVLLRYAVTDAKAFAAVLTDMGGVDMSNAFILSNPSSRELLRGISNLNRMIAESKAAEPEVRNEVFVYYSGHADIDGLKLGSETLSWSDFRNAVNTLDADVRVAVLDACGSGAITRTKGGISRPAFLSDASSNMKGYAFLTSSNENEASQESDRIRGSYFTHALLNGMRGAADLTGDGKVTINEAYQYAFNETLQSTQNTSAGTQHPSRDMNLAGTGDIVMTDLRETSAILSLSADIEGRFFIRDENGHLFAELRKMRGRAIDLGISPGKYTVQMEAPSRRWMANNVIITEGAKTTLTMNDMAVMPGRERTVRRGNDVDGEDGNDDDEYEEYSEYDEEADGDDDSPTTAPAADLRGAEAQAATAPPPSSDSTAQAAETAADTVERYTPYSINANFLGLSLAVGKGSDIEFFPAARGTGTVQGGIVNLANRLDLLQAGVVNIANEVGYVQGGLLVNIAKEVGYVQSGVINVATTAERLQLGTVNAAMAANLQIGVTNIANTSEKLQLGTVNVSNTANRQIGVVNIARHSDKTPVGIISIVGNGIYDLSTYADVTGDFCMSLRTGTPWLYNLIEYSSVPYNEYSYRRGDKRYPWARSTGWGFGTRFGMNGRFAVNLDFVRQNIGDWEVRVHENIIPQEPDNGEGPKDPNGGKDDTGLSSDPFVPPNTSGNPDERPIVTPPEIGANVKIEYSFEYMVKFKDYYKLRLGASYNLLPHVAVTGGVSLNGIFDSYGEAIKHKPAGGIYSDREFETFRMRFWPSLYAGITVGKIRAD